MRRFSLQLDDDLHRQFFMLFPDHGQRTSLTRRCIQRMVARAKLIGYLTLAETDELADKLLETVIGK